MNVWLCPQAVDTVSLENLSYLEKLQDGDCIIAIVLMRELRPSEVKWQVQGHIKRKGAPGSVLSTSGDLIHRHHVLQPLQLLKKVRRAGCLAESMASRNDTIEALAGSEGKDIRQLGTSCIETRDNYRQRLEQFGNATAPGLEEQSTHEAGCLTLQ